MKQAISATCELQLSTAIDQLSSLLASTYELNISFTV